MTILFVSLVHGLIPKIQVTKRSNDAKAHWKTEKGDTKEWEMQGRRGKKEKRKKKKEQTCPWSQLAQLLHSIIFGIRFRNLNYRSKFEHSICNWNPCMSRRLWEIAVARGLVFFLPRNLTCQVSTQNGSILGKCSLTTFAKEVTSISSRVWYRYWLATSMIQKITNL